MQGELGGRLRRIDTPDLEPRQDAVEAMVSMFFGVLFFLVGAALGLAVVIIGKTAGALFAGCGFLCLYTLLAAFVLSGFNRYSTARRFQKEADYYSELFIDAYDSQGRP